MNEIKIKTNFTKRTCIVKGVNLTSGDYNSTKLVFDFDRQDGTKIFEMNNPSGDLLFMDEIKNNEVILVAKQDITTKHNDITYIEYKDNQNNTYYYDSESDKLYDSAWTELAVFNLEDYTKQQRNVSLFSEAGKYTFEVSLYEEDSKLTSASGALTIKQSQVDIDDESVEQYLPVFDTLINDIKDALNEVEEEITKTNNLNIDLSDKVGKNATITLTKKDGTTKTVTLSDGTSLMFNWDGTKLGIKTDDQASYTYVDLKGATGNTGETGNGISSITLNNDYTLTVNYTNGTSYTTTSIRGATGNGIANITLNNDYTLTINYTDGNSETTSSIRGATGATGATPDIQIGTVTSGAEASVTITGTDEEPILNFVLPKGDTGETGATGATGNGILSITKTGTSGLTDTYTITYTNGTTSTFTVKNGKEISSITKTSTSGLVDTYTITFTDSTTATLTVTNGRSITNIEKTSVDGLVDTYTITYNDGTTSTFNVTNGEDGEVTQTQLDETNKRVDLNSKLRNALPKVTGTGTEITLNDTAEAEMVLSLSGNTEQSTTTGKNKLPNSLEALKTNNTNGNWNGRVYTYNGITFTILEDLCVLVNGTTGSSIASLIIDLNSVLQNNVDYILNGCPTGGNTLTYSLRLYKNNLSYSAETGSGLSFTADGEEASIRIHISANQTITNLIFKPMIRLASETDDNYEKFTGGIASPNPDYPQDIVNITGDNSVKINSKNLFDGQWELGSIHGTTGANIDDPLVIRSVNYLPVKSGQTYVINAENNATIIVHFYDENKNYLTLNSAQNTPKIITIPSNAYYVRLRTRQTEKITSLLFKCQLEEGTVSTSYIKGNSQTYPITLGNTEVCENDLFFKNVTESEYYDDTLSLNKWYLKKNTGKKIFDGTENWIATNSGDTGVFYTNALNDYARENNIPSSNYFIGNPNVTNVAQFYSLGNNKIGFNNISTPRLYIRCDELYDTSGDTTAFTEWLSNNNVELQYILATPINVLLNETLQEQLDNILYAYAYQDQTNITQTNDGAPFVIDAEAVADVSKLITNLTNAIIEIGGGE